MTENRPGIDLTVPLTDPAFYADDPYPLFARLRAEAPIAWNEELGFWALSKHADVLEVSKDPYRFCSGRGILLMDLRRELPDVPGALLYVDPPEHGRYRRLVQPAFAPSKIRALEPVIRQRARVLLDHVSPNEPVDVVEALAVPFPLLVIADMLGVPERDWPDMRRWTDALIELATEPSEENNAIAAEMATYFLERIAERAVDPGDDLVSTLATVTVDGEKLDEAELMMFCGQLLVAGNETTRNLISAGLVALAEHPDQWERLVADAELISRAVEELLRWTTPVISFMRTATVDTEIGGLPIAEGDHLLLLYASANRDEEVFGPTADQLDVGREPNAQLAFGFGEHYCIGAALARLEGRIMLEELLQRFRRVEPAGPVTRLASTVIAGITSAPLVFS
ncbi:MAG: cytochrome P450 [Acidimicrobiales bacterium]|nr:cytochrome P450 [Acidimicrobiales bacterium]